VPAVAGGVGSAWAGAGWLCEAAGAGCDWAAAIVPAKRIPENRESTVWEIRMDSLSWLQCGTEPAEALIFLHPAGCAMVSRSCGSNLYLKG
jgi:hypothetical protein